MKFAIRMDPFWQPLLLIGGARPANSYVELGDDGVRFRFGLLFDRTVPYADVKSAFSRSWPILYGIGWRSNLRGVIGLIGSYNDVVEVRLSRRIGRAWGLFPCDRIGVSLEEPGGFIAELGARLGGETAARQPAERGSRAAAGAKRRKRRTEGS